MTSERKIQANRRNAQRSTGPRTPEGKAAVSRNAFKHGLRSRAALFAAPTDVELQPIRNRLIAEWNPETDLEKRAIDHIAVTLHQMEQYEQLELSWSSRILDPELIYALTILSRRQAALRRNYHKSLRTLMVLRLSRPMPPFPAGWTR